MYLWFSDMWDLFRLALLRFDYVLKMNLNFQHLTEISKLETHPTLNRVKKGFCCFLKYF